MMHLRGDPRYAAVSTFLPVQRKSLGEVNRSLLTTFGEGRVAKAQKREACLGGLEVWCVKRSTVPTVLHYRRSNLGQRFQGQNGNIFLHFVKIVTKLCTSPKIVSRGVQWPPLEPFVIL